MDARYQLWVSLSVAALFVGCGGEDAANASEGDNVTKATGSAVLTERAIVLDEAALSALTRARPSGEQVELTFSGESAQLDAIEVGSVVILGPTEPAPNGALLEVDEVERSDGELVLLSHRAELSAAFEELAIELEAELASPSETRGASSALTRGVAVQQQALGLAFPFSFSGDEGGELSGSLAVDSSIGLELDFSFEDGLQELSIRLAADETFSAELVAEGASSFEETLELGSIGFAPITIIVPIPVAPGTLPVVLTPQVVLEASVSGSVAGEARASVLQEASFSAGLGYLDGEFQGTFDSDSTFQFDPPTYEAGANLKASAGPRMEVLIYGAVGPFVATSAFVELAAQVEGPPPCVTGVLNAGVSARAGVDLIADYDAPLPDYREPLAQFDSCNEDGDPEAPRPAITWAKTFARDGSPGETATAVIEASDGSFIVAGHSGLFDGVTGFSAATWVLRLDALGNVIWQRAYQRAALGLTRGLAEVPGGFLVAGNAGVMKIDGGGNPIWGKSYADDAAVVIESIAAQDDGRFVVAGTFGAAARAWAMGLDERGEVLWSRSYAGEFASRVRATQDGGYVVVGKLAESFDISALKLDADGEIVWSSIVDNLFDPNPEEGDQIATSDDRAFDIAEKPDGGYVIAGDAYGNFPLPEPQPVGFYGTWLAELDANGELVEGGSVTHRAPVDGLYGGAYAVAVREDGTSLVVGRRAGTSADLLVNEDVLVIQGRGYSVIGGSGHDAVDGGTLSGVGRGMPLALTQDGGAVLAATTTSFSEGEQIWLLKLSRTASIDLPERSSLEGVSFVNELATSTDFDPSPIEAEVSATTFTLDILWETTELVTAQQAP